MFEDVKKNVYNDVINNIENIEDKLLELSQDSQNKKNQEATQEAYEKINYFYKNRLEKDLENLKINQDWSTLNIAFYGETNAGKSTLIEALRIYLKEVKKVSAWKNRENIKEEDFDKKREELQDEKIKIVDRLETYKRKVKRWEWFYNILKFFHFDLAQRNKNNILSILSEVEDKNDILFDMFDGGIIGDGRSDFTIKTTPYKFNYENKEFIFLDLPGIEGKENTKIDLDEVFKSIQSAHIVFYITDKPRPPQTMANDGKKGTLEKIKEQLSSQTEVYAIYNKKITNPIMLKKENLTSHDENVSLQELDKKLQEVLGKNYSGHKIISALPAFLAIGKYFAPNSKFTSNQKKFLDEFSKDELLKKTEFLRFIIFLMLEVTKNMEKKIKSANYKKIAVSLDEFINLLDEIINKKFIPLDKELSEQFQIANDDCISILQIKEQDTVNECKKSINTFKSKTRQEVYKKIEEDIENSEFKEYLKTNLEVKQDDLKAKLESIVKDNADDLQKKLKNNMKKLQKRALKSSEKFNNFNLHNSYNIDIDIKGKNIFGLLASIGAAIVGVIALFSNPPGWFVLILSIAGFFVSIFKSIASFFSAEYKMSRQKEVTNKVLREIGTQVEKNVKTSLRIAYEKTGEKLYDVLDEIKENLGIFRKASEIISIHVDELRKLSNNIKQEGEVL